MPEIRAATVEDAEQVFELLDARSRAVFGASEVSRTLVLREIRRSIDDRFVAVEDERVVGYAHVRPSHDVVVATGDAATADALLASVEERARVRDVEAIEATVVAADAPFHSLVERSGFAHERVVLRMWRTLDEAIPPSAWVAGVSIRTYDDRDGPAVKALLDDAYAWDAHYAPQSYDEWHSYMTDHDEFDPTLWFLAERSGQLVACALHWKEDNRRGWLKDIAVHESLRGAGLGKSLVRHGLRAYETRGVERVGLKVDAANPTGAAGLYAREGFVIDQRLEIWRKAL
ncbi:MAG TPA: GNAT family N-acetyltransferase [Gaiellaceae bacterium]|nr:GNAT family N-acetyltransferase [Gaiellaceae bacterium]